MNIDLKQEIKSKLEKDETIEKIFEAKNYKMIKESVDVSAGKGAFIVSSDYSFKYLFIVTNKRIFVGNMSPYNEITSYSTYNREDILDIKTDRVEENKKYSLGILYYISGVSTVFIFLYILLSMIIMGITKNKIISRVLSAGLAIGIIYGCYKLVCKITKSKKNVIEINLKDNKNFSIILNDASIVECLKANV